MSEKKFTGIIDITASGLGFLCRNCPEEIIVPRKNVGTAFNGDLVEAKIFRNKNRTEGLVVRVLERAKARFVGRVERDQKRWYLVPDDKRVHRDILITGGPLKTLEEKHKAVIELSEWNNPEQDPEGTLIRTLGPAGEHEVEMEAIVLGQGFDFRFPKAVEEAAATIEKNKQEIFEAEIPKRKDFRQTATFTIDPWDAKDFDDAISVKKLENGDVEIGVHIADVSAYVRENDPIDKEAQNRGTSVYLVDRTIPMLPEVLSNDVCSLNPEEDKLTYSAVFTVDREGRVKERWFGRTVINSDKRFTYEEAQHILDEKKGMLYDELRVADDLALKLREERMKKGGIDFDQDEVKFELDKDMKPVKIFRKQRIETNRLIEDLMLFANREVAKHVNDLAERGDRPVFVYRIHDIPDTDRIEELSVFLRAIGYELEANRGIISQSAIKSLFKQIEGKPEEELIKKATIRSMAKAVYSTKNIGHFGLSFEYYTHFTSPIRRYPDLMVHRLLSRHLNGSRISEEERARFERLSIQSSERELRAVEAERDSIKFKQVEYMAERIGEEFDAVVSGVAEWGIFVEEKNTKSEGLIRTSTLRDHYELDKSGYVLRSKKNSFSLGDKVRVKLERADPETREIDFELVG